MLNKIVTLECYNPKCKYYKKPIKIKLKELIKGTNCGLKYKGITRVLNINGIQCTGCLNTIVVTMLEKDNT